MEYKCECGKGHIFKCHKCEKNASCVTKGDFLMMKHASGLESFWLCDSCLKDAFNFIQPERSKREDHESGCGALNTVETQ
jgi:hypothetical protein